MIGIGIGINKIQGGLIDSQASAHFDRVYADGGIIPAGLVGCNAWIKAVKAVYGATDITTAISAGYDPHYLGAKIGAGSGTTLGQAATKLYSCCGASGDLLQTTAASQPLLLEHTGTNYYFAPNVSGNYCSTSSTYQNDDWDVEFNVKGKYSIENGRIAGTRSIGDGTNVSINGSGITLEYRTGSVIYLATASTTNTDDVEYTVRVTRNSITGAITFIKNGVTLTTSGSQVAGVLTSNSYVIEVNGVWQGVQGFLGKINWVKFYQSGSVVRYFNPASYNAATSQTQWTSATGEVWTINTGTATTGYKGVLVDRTVVQGDGLDDTMSSTGLTNRTSFTKYVAEKYYEAAAYMTSNSSNAFLIYTNGAGVPRMSAASEVVFNGATQYTKIDLLTSILGVTGKTYVNNTNETTGDLSGSSGTGIYLFASSSGSNFMNCSITTLIETAQGVISQTTEMYNALRGFNNNAF